MHHNEMPVSIDGLSFVSSTRSSASTRGRFIDALHFESIRGRGHIDHVFDIDARARTHQPPACVRRRSVVCIIHTLVYIVHSIIHELLRSNPRAMMHHNQRLVSINGLSFASSTRSSASTRGRFSDALHFASIRGRGHIDHVFDIDARARTYQRNAPSHRCESDDA